jgi:LysR family hydrogen peroxide-inducible transcriptional activator
VETRRAAVSVVRFGDPQPSRTIGMIWRKTSPLAGQLRELSEAVRRSAEARRGEPDVRQPAIGPRKRAAR